MHNTRCFLFLYYRLVSRKKFSIWMTLLRKVSSKTSRAFSLCCTVAAVSSSKNGSLQKSSTARPYPLVASAQARAQKVYRFSHQAGLFSFLDSRKKWIKAYSARFAHRSTKSRKNVRIVRPRLPTILPHDMLRDFLAILQRIKQQPLGSGVLRLLV